MKTRQWLRSLHWLWFVWVLAAPNARAFCNPSAGRWLSRDPIEERGGVNLTGFCQNNGINHFDKLGRDYYVVTTEGACGVKHRVMIGDDGKGGHYRVDFSLVVEHWWQSFRRFCGKGKFSHTPGKGSAADAVGNLYDIERRIETTAEQDERLAQAAGALDGVEKTYCLVVKDCRAIERCVLERVLESTLFDALKKALNDALKNTQP